MACFARYQELHPDDTVQGISTSGPIYVDTSSEESQQFWLLCAAQSFDPENGFAYLNLANAYLAHGSPDAARETLLALKEMTDREPFFMGYHDEADFQLGWLEADLGNFDTALTWFDSCARRWPERQAEIDLFKGSVHHEAGRFREAAKLYASCAEKLEADERIAAERLQADAGAEIPFRGKRRWPIMTFGTDSAGA